mmetsp:Transcript_62263/g.157314  ORF Transcript_62263/g.157314 Transcript_62263/m.157314 type:complete len:317 (+) Transcript_62263:60-1010(+)
MAPIAAADIYPAVRRFLLECGLQRALKAFDKETSFDESVEVSKGKKAKALTELELTEACQLWLDERRPVVVADGAGNTEEPKKKDKRKANAEVEAPAPAVMEDDGTPASIEERPKKKGRKDSPEAEKAEQTRVEACEAVEVAEEQKVEKKDKKKKEKADKQEEGVKAPKVETNEKDEEADEGERETMTKKKDKTSEAVSAQEEVAEISKADKTEKKKKAKAAERTPGVPFKRIDDDKWKATIKDSRLMDNTHKAKDRFGESAGDSWGDKAAEDLLKVKGKGFRKEMAKKKRASWRGGGEIDQGVNSIKLDDSSDEE